jgi:hypothetical protein
MQTCEDEQQAKEVVSEQVRLNNDLQEVDCELVRLNSEQ